MILMVNCMPHSFQIEKGTRIAQFILERIIANASVVEVDELPASTRASGGFGSTGYHTFLTMDPEDHLTPTEAARLDAYLEHERRDYLRQTRARAEGTVESGVPASSGAAGGPEGAVDGGAVDAPEESTH